MKESGKDDDKKRSQSDESRRQLDAGWRGPWFRILLTGLSERDVSRIAIAIAFAIVAIALTCLAFAFTLIWDRVSTLWQ